MFRPRCFPSGCAFSGLAALFCLVGLGTLAQALFETRATFAISGGSFAVAVGDFNRDGKLDVAVPTGSSLTIFLGNGDGTFKQGASYTADGLNYIAAADFNNDGILDLVVSVATDTTSIEVFLGNGDGTFQTPKSSPTTEQVTSLAVGDFNGDHKLDLAVADDLYVSILLGNGDGTFQAPIDNSSFVGPHQVAIADFNNDHNLDVAVVGYSGGNQNLGIMLGNGDGTLQSAVSYPLTYVPESVVAADFRHDGVEDVAIGDGGGGVTVLLGNGDGTFGPQQRYQGGGGPGLAVGDFNHDGKLDLIANPSVGYGVAEFLGNGDGTFQTAKVSLSGGEGTVAAAGDLNNDRLPDAVLLDRNHAKVTSMLSTGVLVFSPSSPVSFPAQLVNTRSEQSVKLTNDGPTAVSISSIKASGIFQVSNTCGGSVAPGANCDVTVTFQPTSADKYSGLVAIVDTASSKPQVIEVSGWGTALNLSPTALNFGDEKTGTTGPSQQVTATNESSATVIFSSISVGGLDRGDFKIETNTCGASLAPGGNCNVSVAFSPTRKGSRKAQLVIAVHGGANPSPVALAGTGT